MKTKELEVLKMRLKSGEYDGTHIMQAWLAIDELIKSKTKIDDHNNECVRVCELNRNGSHMACDPRYGPDKRRTCPDCPRDWMIEE